MAHDEGRATRTAENMTRAAVAKSQVKGHRAYVSFCEFLVVLADLRTMAFHIAGATHQARETTPLPGTLPAILLASRFGWHSRVLGRFREPPSKIVQTCLCFLCLDGES
jgi:hypothetical protein